jgi:ribose transport system substrate-binding protein
LSTLKKSAVAVLGIVLLTAILAACGSSDSSSSSAGTGGSTTEATEEGGSTSAATEEGGEGSEETASDVDLSGDKVTLLSLTPSCATCASLTESAAKAMEEAGIAVTTETSEFEGAAEQIGQFNQALSTDPAAIVIWPTDTTSIIPVLARARQSNPDTKIIVTTYKPETDEEGLYDAYVGASDETLGANQAKAMVEGLEEANIPVEGGVIEIEGAPGAGPTIERKAGFDNELAKIAPKLKIVGHQTANWDQTEATTTTSALIAKNADQNIVGFFAHSDVMLNGAILAATRAGMSPGKDSIAVGVDCDIEGYNNIKAGKEYATGLWDPFLIGEEVGNTAVKVLKGEEVPLVTDVDVVEIKKENVSDCDNALGK